ncbi:MAG: class I SAM-dependent RNA methyltransferase [Thermodesulfovibrionales bacterium]
MSAVLKAEAPVYGGYVISRNDGIVFIRGALPGEVVEVRVSEKKRDYSVATVTEIIEPSSFRTQPPCRHFGDCGGCHLQFAAYDKQVAMKSEVLSDCLRRIGGVEAELGPALTGGDFHYRRRAQFKVSKDGRVGFFREGTREVVPLDECPLMVAEINSVLPSLGPAPRGIREIHVTNGQDGVLALLKGRDFDESIAERFIQMGFQGVAFEDALYGEKGFVRLDLLGLTYTVGPSSFFQSNWDLNVKVVALLKDGLGPLEGKRVLDLYAGAGNFSLPLASEAAEVVGVEENPQAVRDGQRNLLINKIKNFRFVSGKAETAKLGGAFDIVVLDPPRPGLTKEAMKRVLELASARVAYVSCNPATLARDLKKMAGSYRLDSIRMVDLFPHTYHIEAIALLTRKG